MRNWITLVACVAGPLITGAVAGIITAQNITSWYSHLHKPSFNPPNYLFGPVWTLLYVLMGISFYMILQTPKSSERKKAIVVFVVQWILNFIWSFLFFQFHWILGALVEIILLWISIILMIILFKNIKPVAGYLQVPYLLWVSFATVLTASIYYLNT